MMQKTNPLYTPISLVLTYINGFGLESFRFPANFSDLVSFVRIRAYLKQGKVCLQRKQRKKNV